MVLGTTPYQPWPAGGRQSYFATYAARRSSPGSYGPASPSTTTTSRTSSSWTLTGGLASRFRTFRELGEAVKTRTPPCHTHHTGRTYGRPPGPAVASQ